MYNNTDEVYGQAPYLSRGCSWFCNGLDRAASPAVAGDSCREDLVFAKLRNNNGFNAANNFADNNYAYQDAVKAYNNGGCNMPGYPQNGFGGGFQQTEAQMGYGFGWRQEYSQGTGPEYEAQELWTAEADEEFAQVHVFGPQGEQVPGAVTTFQQAQGMFPDILVHKLIEAGFTAPTPIQAHTWAIGVAGRDLIGIAKTGSGKTLAFLMPGFLKITQTRSRLSGS